MQSIEANIGNTNQPLYHGIQLENMYYSGFDNYPDYDDVVLPYSQDIKDQNTEEVGEAYVRGIYG